MRSPAFGFKHYVVRATVAFGFARAGTHELPLVRIIGQIDSKGVGDADF